MSQLALFQLTSEAFFHDIAVTPEVETALARNCPVAVSVSGGQQLLCKRLAQSLRTELLIVRRSAGGLLARRHQCWEGNKARYSNLDCVRLIMTWSAAGTRFCTSELKTAVACRALATRFPGSAILSVIGIRRAESATRSKAAICTPQPRLIRKRTGTFGWNWHPML